MKITKLTITNIGMIENEVIPTTDPLILFYGQIKQGKTTILNCVRYVFGGAFPDDLLKHGKAEGAIRIDFEGGYLARTFYRTDTGSVKARPLDYVADGKKVAKPVDTLKQFLNPFLLDQDHLVRMNPLERNKFFVELFEAGSEGIDRALTGLETKAREVRAKIAGYGDIDLTPYKRADVEDLKTRLRIIVAQNSDERKAVLAAIAEQDAFNKSIAEKKERHALLQAEREELQSRLASNGDELVGLSNYLGANPQREQIFEPEITHTTELEDRISNAAAQNVRVELYEKNVARESDRKVDCLKLSDLEAEERALREQRIKRLTEINSAARVPGLVFHADESTGAVTFSYENTAAGMLSTSQLIELSSKLSALYPEGFGIELLDRGESLGRSIFEYVERAKSENKTILATIVGERPATVPDNVGVFVVADGKLSQ